MQYLSCIAAFLCCAFIYEVKQASRRLDVCRWVTNAHCNEKHSSLSTRIHGLNERISVENYEKQVEFLFQLIKNCDIEKLPEPHANSHEL